MTFVVLYIEGGQLFVALKIDLEHVPPLRVLDG